ncbi:ATP-binding protein [Malaciobacter marinus]|uniref:ATP-binding protein n=1 Tax=Malaciobacter marinus TaxID=505249 RepID=UPI0013563870|nr:ATP-binding protein [Malaciobacter marinus]
MLYRQNAYKYLLLFVILALSVVLFTSLYIHNKEKNLLDSKYKESAKNTKEFIKNLIENKQNATLAIAISLAKDDRLYSYMKNKTYKNFEYEKISSQMREYTKFKNVWIQIIDKNGTSIYRSWTKKTNDNLLFRKDLNKMLKKQDITTSISVGKFDLSIKARTPIFDDDKFLGALEVITHFNSISKRLKKRGIDAIIAVDKKYKSRLTFPLTTNFIDDYYISNLDASKKFINYLKQNNINNYFNIKDYKIENTLFITSYELRDDNGGHLASIISFKDKNSIDIQAIKDYKRQMIMLVVILLIILVFIFTLYVYNIDSKNVNRLNNRLKKHIKQLKIQENKKQSILDSQSSIMVITDGVNIINANKQLLKFFKDIRTLQEFREKYVCVCTEFIDMQDNSYIFDKDYDGKNWAEYILSKPHKNFKAAMKNHYGSIRHFSVKVSKGEYDDYIIVTLADISSEIEQKQQLKYLNNNLEKLVNKKTLELKKLNESLEDKIKDEIFKSQEKDRLLFQQSKITAIAETLNNIAHQWRQPLSTISTATSGMQLQKEMQILDDETFNDSCETILRSTKTLSKTIDNFSNFFVQEKQKIEFKLSDSIHETLKFLNSTFEEKNIIIDYSMDKDIKIYGYKQEFQQSLLSIFDNAIYAVCTNKDIKNRIISIEIKNNCLSIRDSGDGIDEEDLDKVLEPYFTKKHQAFGIGMGLYMVQELLVKHMKYEIEVKNSTFSYNNKEYYGALIFINFN